jgi:hypothetical protein
VRKLGGGRRLVVLVLFNWRDGLVESSSAWLFGGSTRGEAVSRIGQKESVMQGNDDNKEKRKKLGHDPEYVESVVVASTESEQVR